MDVIGVAAGSLCKAVAVENDADGTTTSHATAVVPDASFRIVDYVDWILSTSLEKIPRAKDRNTMPHRESPALIDEATSALKPIHCFFPSFRDLRSCPHHWRAPRYCWPSLPASPTDSVRASSWVFSVNSGHCRFRSRPCWAMRPYLSKRKLYVVLLSHSTAVESDDRCCYSLHDPCSDSLDNPSVRWRDFRPRHGSIG